MSHHIDHAEIEREQRELAKWREIQRLARLDEIQQGVEEELRRRSRESKRKLGFVACLVGVAGIVMLAIVTFAPYPWSVWLLIGVIVTWPFLAYTILMRYG